MAKVRVSAAGGEFEFSCAQGTRILHAGLAGGAPLPYECGSGTCGKCRASLVSGEVIDLWPGAPGKAATRPARRELLMCQSAPAGDVQLSLPRAGPVPVPVPEWFAGTVRSVQRLAPGVMEIGVALAKPMRFHAGQFILLEAAGVEGPRAYSMVNFEPAAMDLRLLVRQRAGGALSAWLFEADRTGSPVRVFGPLGRATFDAASDRDLLCIAGGSGVAGMLSIARCAIERDHLRAHRLDLHFGVRSAQDLFYAAELESLVDASGGGMHVTVALSGEEPSEALRTAHPRLRFVRGLVHEAALADCGARLANATTFLAGPPAAVDAGIRGLLAARVPLARIRYDKFA